MGYYLSAFVGKSGDLECIQKTYGDAAIIELGQGLSLIPLTEALFDQINNFVMSGNINSFEYLTFNIEREIFKIIEGKTIAYIEAEYFGGQGGQQGMVWKDGKRSAEFKYRQGVINAILKLFGVTASKNKDEFETLGFGRHRNTRDWQDR
jgi:hypothetical protein